MHSGGLSAKGRSSRHGAARFYTAAYRRTRAQAGAAAMPVPSSVQGSAHRRTPCGAAPGPPLSGRVPCCGTGCGVCKAAALPPRRGGAFLVYHIFSPRVHLCAGPALSALFRPRLRRVLIRPFSRSMQKLLCSFSAQGLFVYALFLAGLQKRGRAFLHCPAARRSRSCFPRADAGKSGPRQGRELA